MTFLKKSKSGVPSLKRLIHYRLPHYSEPRPISLLHASEVTSTRQRFCPRAYALMDATDKTPRRRFIGTALALTFDLGHATQQVITETVTEHLFGDWVCLGCKDRKTLCTKPKAAGCDSNAGKHRWQYEEVRVTSEYSGISCGLDLVVRFNSSTTRLFELKIIDKDYFKTKIISVPLAEHRRRTNLYLRCIAESNHPIKDIVDTETAGILYVGRMFGVSDPEVKAYSFRDDSFSNLKEFEVIRDDDASNTDVEMARTIHLHRTQGTGMPCGICDTALDKPAKYCPVRDECFSGDYDGTVTWMEQGEPRHPKAEVL